MRIVKWLVIALLLIIVVVPVGALAILHFVGLERFKPQIEAQLTAATGRDVTLAGPIELALSLHPTLRVEDAHIANAEWASEPEMLAVGRLEAQVALQPLLQRRIEIDRIVVEGARLALETNDAGVGNWELGGEADRAQEGGTPTSDDSSDNSGSPMIPVLHELRVADSVVTFKAGPEEAPRTLAIDDIRLAADSATDPLVLTGDLAADEEPIRLEGQFGAIAELDDDPESYPVEITARTLGSNLTIAGAIAKPLSAPALGLDIAYELAEPAALRDGLARQGVDLPEQFAPEAAQLQAKLVGDAASPALTELAARLRAAGIDLEINGEIADLTPPAGIQLAVAAKGDDLGALLGPGAPGPLALSAEIGGDLQRVEISAFDLELGDSAVTGELAVTDLAGLPRLTGNLHAPLLDVAALGPAGDGEPNEAPPAGSDEGRIIPDTPLDLSALRMAEADLDLTIDRITLPSAAEVTGLETHIALAGGRLAMEPLTAQVLESPLAASFEVEAREVDSAIALDATFDPLALGTLLETAGITGLIDGVGRFGVKLAGAGASPAAIAGDISGNIAFLIDRGRLRSSILDGLPGPVRDTLLAVLNPSGGWIVIDCAAIGAPVEAGVVELRTALARTAIATVTADGKVDLGAESLGIVIRPRASVAVVDVAVPVTVGGTLAEPTFNLDANASIGGLLGDGGSTGDGVDTGPFAALGTDNACLEAAPAGGGSAIDLPADVGDVKDQLENAGDQLEDAGSRLRGLLGR